MYPTVKRMVKMGFSERVARDIRDSMENFPTEIALEQINGFMDGCGIEHIKEGSGDNSPAISYVNMGDSYDTTILLINDTFYVGDWAYYVERGNY